MVSNDIELRYAHADDSEALLEWRNDGGTIEASLEGAPVERDDHERWFSASLVNPLRTIYIARTIASETRVGMCRFDRDDTEALISINVAPSARGRGLGIVILTRALERFHGDCPEVRVVRATVKTTNEASVRLFTHAGFSLEGTVDELHSFSRRLP